MIERLRTRLTPDFGGILSGSYRRPMAVISCGICVHGFNELAIAPVIPRAVADLGAEVFLPWAYAIFFAAVIAGGVTSSGLRAQLGGRRAAIFAALLYVVGIMLNVTATSGEQILLGRALQGLADGWIVALCYSLIPEIFGQALVARVMAFEAVIWAFAAMLGPALGGTAVDLFNWRIGFAVSLPVVLAFLITGALYVPNTRGLASERMRAAHMVTVLCCVAAILVLLIPSAAPDLPGSALALPVGGLMLLLILRHDSGREFAFFPRQVFRLKGTVGLGGWVLLLATAGQSISTVFLAYTLHAEFDISARYIGMIILFLPLAWTLSAIPAGQIRDARVLRVLLRTGPVCQMLGGLSIMYGLSHHRLELVMLGQFIIGIGLGAIWGPVSDAVISAAEEATRSRVGSLLPPVTTAGYVLGSGFGGWLATHFGLFETAAVPPREAIVALWGTMVGFAVLTFFVVRGVQPGVAEPEWAQACKCTAP